MQCGEHGETTYEFGNKAEFFEVHGLDILKHVVAVEFGARFVALEAYDIGIES